MADSVELLGQCTRPSPATTSQYSDRSSGARLKLSPRVLSSRPKQGSLLTASVVDDGPASDGGRDGTDAKRARLGRVLPGPAIGRNAKGPMARRAASSVSGRQVLLASLVTFCMGCSSAASRAWQQAIIQSIALLSWTGTCSIVLFKRPVADLDALATPVDADQSNAASPALVTRGSTAARMRGLSFARLALPSIAVWPSGSTVHRLWNFTNQMSSCWWIVTVEHSFIWLPNCLSIRVI